MLAALVAPIQAAHAADTTIDFEDLPSNTQVTDQYSSRGLVFGENAAGYAGGLPEIRDYAAVATSGTHVAELTSCGGEFCGYEVYGHLVSGSGDAGHMYVAMKVAYTHPNSSSYRLIELIARDAAGNEVGRDSHYVYANDPPSPFSVYTGIQNITYFEIATGAGACCFGVYMDDLSFDSPDVITPDFALGRPYPYRGDVGVAPGHSVGVPLIIRRVNGSNGNIEFTAENLPTGVTASFNPNIVTGSGKASVLMSLVAKPTAAPVKDQIVTVTAVPDGPNVAPGNHTTTVPVTVARTYALRVRGMEVTQGIQSRGPGNLELPDRDAAHRGTTESPVPYWGVRLQAGGKTIVRLFGDVQNIDSASNVGAELFGYDAGRRPLPGSPLLAQNGPGELYSHSAARLTYLERIAFGAESPFLFTLPDSWTHGTIELRGVLLPSMYQDFEAPAALPCDTGDCYDLREFAMSGIHFRPVDTVTIAPVYVNLTGYDVPPPWRVFSEAANLTPLNLVVPPYMGEIEAIDITNSGNPADAGDRKDMSSEALDRISDWADDNGHPGQIAIGVSTGISSSDEHPHGLPDLGLERGGPDDPVYRGYPVAVVNSNSPLDSVAHELTHGLGRPHAGRACGAEDTDNGAVENWDPDGVGYIEGVGIDRRQFPYPVRAPGLALQPAWFDFMSYCTGRDESISWVSDRGWNDVMGRYSEHGAPAARTRSRARDDSTPAASGSGSLEIHGFRSSDDVQITRIELSSRPPLPSVKGSPFRAKATNGAGKVVANVGLGVTRTHVDFAKNPAVVWFSGRLPRRSIDRVEIFRKGVELTSRERGASPTIRITSPQKGARIGERKSVTVRWVATDPDGAAFSTTVDYSRNGGKTWRTLFVGTSASLKGHETMSSALFAGSRNARVRVRLNDGFNQVGAVSPVFVAVHHRPLVRIISPRAEQKLRQDGTQYLSGAAFDERGHRLTGRSLTWFLGTRKLGHGEHLSVAHLPGGSARLKLRAVDSKGLVGRASIGLKVKSDAPLLTVLRYPRTIATTRTHMTLRVASDVPAHLVVRFPSDRRVTATIGPRVKALRLAVGKGKSVLELRLRLTAHRLSSFGYVRVHRR